MINIESIHNEPDTLTKVIVGTVPIEQIYLFGSYTYETFNKDFDFDLYVVLKNDVPIRELEALDADAISLATYKKQNRAIVLLLYKKSKFLDRSTNVFTIEKVISIERIKIYG